ncbi:MAG TPA: hypothetical protein VGL53_07745 [Bryobacteraceae bacterium]|jgi:hypothetical protein
MDFGPHTVHIFISLIVVLAAAGVALVCDLLKGNNEHLRELAVELKIRNEEAERRVQAAERKPGGRTLEPIAARTSQIASGQAAGEEMPVTRREAAPEPVEVPRAAPQQEPRVAAAAASSQQQGSERSRPERRKRTMSPAVAAVAQAAAAIVNNKDHQQTAAFAQASEPVAMASSTSSLETGVGNPGRKNWDTILKNTRSRQGSVIPFESIRDAVPAGVHDASVLQRAVESGRMVSGLILSIGTNALDQASAVAVADFLKVLAGPQDFFCQSGSDEYVLICPGEQNASAQRRLSEIAEKLWDFQLRSIGGLSVQFSWGSSEARGERIGEAVATAIEQMQETRQSRRVNIAKAV